MFDVNTMEELVYRSATAPRFNAALLGDLRGACPVLAAVGIYGVITYAVK